MPTEQGRPARAKKPASARKVALEILQEVDETDAYANILLNQKLRTAGLSQPDAGFATELVSGTLRMRLLYDHILERVTNRTLDEIDPLTLNILRMAVHQLLTLRTGAHAAVNESVELQRAFGKQSATGFVNGVLRAVAKQNLNDWIDALLAHANSEDARLSIRYAHPEWIIRALRDALAAEGKADELEDLLAADNVSPRVNLALLPGASLDAHRLDELVREGLLRDEGPSPLGWALEKGSPAQVIGDAELAEPGTLRVQDQGSQLAALALARVSGGSRSGDDEAGSTQWLDLCAGPGGKTAILAAEATEQHAKLRAVELFEHRAQLVRSAVRAHKEAVTVVTEDGTTTAAFADRRYDRILVDAPCTGLGALRRRPESRLRKKAADVASLTVLQHQLLSAAADHLAEGGIVAYVTCSPHLAETRSVVDRVLRERHDLVELDAKTIVQQIARQDLDLAGKQLSAQLWPHRNETDAMFIALLQRRLGA